MATDISGNDMVTDISENHLNSVIEHLNINDNTKLTLVIVKYMYTISVVKEINVNPALIS